MKNTFVFILCICFAVAVFGQEPTGSQTATSYYSSGIEKESQGNHDGAIADFNYAISLDPKYTDAYIARGISKWTNDNLDGAWEDFDLAISLDSTSGKAYYYRGLAYIEYYYYEDGCLDLYQALQLGYTEAEYDYEENCEY